MFPGCFYAFSLSLSTFSWGLFGLLVLKRRLSSSVRMVQQDFCAKEIQISTVAKQINSWSCWWIKSLWGRLFRVVVIEVICECTNLLLGCTSAALGGELQDGQQRSQPQAQGENQKHPLQAVWLHSWKLGLVCHAAAGPPLAPQVSQLPCLAQLQDCHAEVLYEGWTLRKVMNVNNTVFILYVKCLYQN